MGYEQYRLMLSLIGVIMFFYHLFYYRKLGPNKVSFPLYIYMAMFPYDFSRVLPYSEFFLQMLLILGIISLVFSNKKVRFNKFELTYLVVVILTSFINVYLNDYNLFNSYLLNLIYVLVFSFYSFNTITSTQQMEQTFRIFVINTYVLTLCAILEYYLVGINRPEVGLGNPNYFGLYIFIGLICALFINKRVSSYILLIVLVAYSIILSGSNTIILIILIQFIFWMIVRANSKTLFRLFWIGFGSITTFYMYVTISFNYANSGLLQYFVKEDDLSRIYIWKGAWNTFSSNIFHGVGYGNLLIPFADREFVTHNDYLRILGEVGLIGFIVLAFYFIFIINRLNLFKQRTTLFLGFFFLAILVFSLTHNNMNSILFWWFISLPLYKSVFNDKDHKI
ncbi:hypothetical protein ABE67_22910 [Cytobacillus firmus]|uniref:O-antigen ligase family protein n=1 Tax=Cytobacillus firmus TaxID=1399 RepID=UPI0018CEA6B9|nr:hypothetical protein [Cytobacillus firmus]